MDLTTEAIRLGMNMARLRAEVASSNIAGVDVAGHRTQRADFGTAIGLLREAATTRDIDAGSLAAQTPSVLRAAVRSSDFDRGTSASLDGQVAELETAGTDFQSLATIMSRRFALMQLALVGRN
ncbi:MAG: hypothetical protein ABI114_01730 [Rhodanobacter sp.]